MFDGIKCVIRQETGLIPVFLYGIIKLLLPSNNSDGDVKFIILSVFRPILALVLTIPALIFLVLCALYFELVIFLAKNKYGARYISHFAGADAVWSFDRRQGSSVIHSINLIEDQGPETPEKLFNFVRRRLLDEVLHLHPKLSSVREYFLGYYFFVKDEVHVDELMGYLDEYEDYEGFMKLVTDLCSKPMPRDDKCMIQMCIGRTRIEVEPGRLLYPSVLRIHHSLGDGLTFNTFFVTSFVDDGYNMMKSKFHELLSKIKRAEGLGNERESSLWQKIWNTKIYFHHDVLQHVEPSNVLHRGPISNRKVLALSAEGSAEDYAGKIKIIRKKMKVSHSDVLLAAIAATLTEHYAQHQPDHPPFISTGTTFLLKGLNFDDLVQMHGNTPVVNLGNKFTVGHWTLPLNEDFLEDPRLFIQATKEQTASIRKGLDLLFFYWVFNINCTIVPKPLASKLLERFDCTTITTNTPGPEDIVLSNGCKLVDSFAFSIHWKNIGSCIGLYIFKDRMRFTLNVDREFVDDVGQAQKICDGFFKYIDKMYESVS